MQIFNFSNFEKIATMFSVADILKENKIFYCNEEETFQTFKKYFDNPDSCTIVKNEENIIGYMSDYIYWDFYKEIDSCYPSIDNELRKIDQTLLDKLINIKIKDLSLPIYPNMCVPKETHLIQMLNLFCKRDFYFVLDKDEIIGFVKYENMNCNEVKISIFALILELDNLLIDYLKRSNIEKKEKPVLEKFIEKIKKNENNNGRIITIFDFNFRAKFDIIKNYNVEKYNQLFNFADQKEIKVFINTLCDVRNKIAHGDSILTEILGEERKTITIIEMQDLATHQVIEDNHKAELIYNKEKPILSSPQKMSIFISKLLDIISNLKNIKFQNN